MMQHIHGVGLGIAEKMRELDDTPASCEPYPFVAKLVNGALQVSELAGEISIAVGKSGMVYVYTPDSGTSVLVTLDMLIAGGVV